MSYQVTPNAHIFLLRIAIDVGVLAHHVALRGGDFLKPQARRGIEPRIFGLRDRRLTTWPPSQLAL